MQLLISILIPLLLTLPRALAQAAPAAAYIADLNWLFAIADTWNQDLLSITPANVSTQGIQFANVFIEITPSLQYWAGVFEANKGGPQFTGSDLQAVQDNFGPAANAVNSIAETYLNKIGNCPGQTLLSNQCLQGKLASGVQGAIKQALPPFVIAWSDLYSYLLWRFPVGTAHDAVGTVGYNVERELDAAETWSEKWA